jgi:hypothetical protein
MKYKIIILLAVLLTGGLSATPNKSCKGMRCRSNEEKKAPVRTVMMMIDETELMPMHYFLRNF